MVPDSWGFPTLKTGRHKNKRRQRHRRCSKSIAYLDNPARGSADRHVALVLIDGHSPNSFARAGRLCEIRMNRTGEPHQQGGKR